MSGGAARSADANELSQSEKGAAAPHAAGGDGGDGSREETLVTVDNR